ncbi:MAG: hypothetical protein V1755_13235 [Chloroflexota bacterium]
MSRRNPIVFAVCVIALATLACDLAFAPAQVPSEAQSTAVAAVALRLDAGRSQLSSYVGPGTQAWDLEPGSYGIHAVNQSGMTIVFSEMQIVDVPLIWPVDFRSAGGTQDPSRAAAVKTLVGFLVNAEVAKLTALEHSSGGFTAPLFSVEPGQAELDDLYSRYSSIVSQQDAVLAALDTLRQSPGAGGAPPRMAAPRRDWEESLFGFFGYAGGAGERARDRILLIAEGMSPEDQADAFAVLRDKFKDQASDFDDLAAKLQNGELDDQAAQIESDMRNSPGFGASAQEAEATVGQVFHGEGAQLVVKGAEFQVEVVKHVLGQAFPDIAEGFDLADKASEWIEYVESVYKNPLLAAEGELRGAVQEKIKERILDQLKACCGALAEDIAEAIADDLSEQAMEAVPSVVESIQATQTALAGQPAAPGSSEDGAARLLLTGSFHEDLSFPEVSEVDFSADIELTADREQGTITGTITGAGTYNVDFECESERGVASYSLNYTADVQGTLNPDTGEFSTAYAPSGVASFVEMAQPFAGEECVDMNSDLNVTLPFVGAGTLEGVIYADGAAEVITEWSLLEAGVMRGTWSGQGQAAS